MGRLMRDAAASSGWKLSTAAGRTSCPSTSCPESALTAALTAEQHKKRARPTAAPRKFTAPGESATDSRTHGPPVNGPASQPAPGGLDDDLFPTSSATTSGIETWRSVMCVMASVFRWDYQVGTFLGYPLSSPNTSLPSLGKVLDVS